MPARPGISLTIFSALAALSFAIVAGSLLAVLITFILPSGREVLRTLVTVTLLVGSLALLLLSFQLLFHAWKRRDRTGNQLERSRLRAWLAFLAGDGPLPPLDVASARTLCALRETTIGDQSERLARLYAQYGFLDLDMKALASSPGRNSTVFTRLSKIRHPEAIPTLQGVVDRGSKSEAIEAMHVLARTLDSEVVPPEAAQDAFLSAISNRTFTEGEVESALVLTGRHSQELTRHLLMTGSYPRAALHVVGHHELVDLAPLVRPYLTSPQPEVLAAALRAVSALRISPPGAATEILASLASETAFVRAQAAKACVAVGLDATQQALVRALADPDWWVRRNAATTLSSFGKRGMLVLQREALSNTDRFAREAAERACR